MARGAGSGWASMVVVGSVTAIALTADRLPLRVASHFGASGLANGFMTRGTYLAFTIGIVVLLPALIGLLIAASVRYFPGLVNIPNREYWLAPERREATADYLTTHAAWLAAGFALFALAIHVLVIRANRSVPAQLETAPFITLIMAFVVGVVAWIGALARRFTRH